MRQTTTFFLIMAGVATLTGWAPASLVTLPELGPYAEHWRLITGHFVHADANHLLMNGAGLLACGLLFERDCRWHFTGLLLTGIAFVNVWLLGFSTLSAYCGMSGALNAVFVGGCMMRFSEGNTWAAKPSLHYMWLALPLLDLMKIALEASTGNALFSESSWAPAPLAHLAGWLAGLCYFALWRSRVGSAGVRTKCQDQLQPKGP